MPYNICVYDNNLIFNDTQTNKNKVRLRKFIVNASALSMSIWKHEVWSTCPNYDLKLENGFEFMENEIQIACQLSFAFIKRERRTK